MFLCIPCYDQYNGKFKSNFVTSLKRSSCILCADRDVKGVIAEFSIIKTISPDIIMKTKGSLLESVGKFFHASDLIRIQLEPLSNSCQDLDDILCTKILQHVDQIALELTAVILGYYELINESSSAADDIKGGVRDVKLEFAMGGDHD